MFQEIIRSEYERSIDRLRGRRDRIYQIARISGTMFAIFAIVTIFIQSRGGEIPDFPKFTFIAGFTILTVFGIVLPVSSAYVRWKLPWVLSERSLSLAQEGVITDDRLCRLMIYCTRENRKVMGRFERKVKWMVYGMILGISMVLVAVVVAVVALYL